MSAAERIVVERPEISVVVVGELAIPPAGSGGEDSQGSTFDKTASESVSAYRVVVTDGDAGALLAQNTDATHASRVLGVTENAAAPASILTVRRFGEITFAGWAWTPDLPIFVGANGLLTQTPPASPAVFSQIIAFAKTATSIFVWPREAVSII